MRHLAALLALLAPSLAYAGAWTQAKGEGQLILTGLYYATETLFSNRSNVNSQARYTKYELNPYLEYGWTDDITVGANLSLQRAEQANAANWGLGDSEFFLRKRLWQEDGFVLSVEPMMKLPSPEPSGDSPSLGGRHPDLGIGLSGGYGFSLFERNHFINIDSQYRQRFGEPKNQIKLAGTLGISLDERWMAMPQLFATLRADKPRTATFTQSDSDDYDLLKFQMSGIYKVDDTLSLQFGAFSHVSGRNVGAGEGAIFSVWKRF